MQEKNVVKQKNKIKLKDEKVKTNKKNNHKIIVIVITVIIILIAVIVSYFGFFNKSEAHTFTVEATKDSNIGINLQSTFKIASNIDTDIEHIENSFKIEPNVEYKVNQTNEREFEIVPYKDLESNKIYNVQYQNSDGKIYKWSFQTINVYRVVGTYPSNETTRIPINTGIEINLSYNPIEDVNEYFEISPKVEGTFEYKYNKITFIPNESLKKGTIYAVTLKKGFSSTETEKLIENDYVFSFETESNSGNKLINVSKNLMSFTSDSAININFYIDEKTYDTEKIELAIYSYKSESDFVKTMDYMLKSPIWSALNNSLKNIDTSKLDKVMSFETTLGQCGRSYDRTLSVQDKLSQGYYIAEIIAKGEKTFVNIQVNNIIAVVNSYQNSVNVWVNDTKEDISLQNASIILNNEEKGKTDKNGLFIVKDIKENENGMDKIAIKHRDNFTLYMYEYLEFYEQYNDNTKISYLYTDKEMYRQNELINVWGFIKNRNGNEINNISIEIFDWNASTLINSEELEVDEFGGFETNFKLENYLEGYYGINLLYNGKIINSKSIEIKKYTNQNYIVTLSMDKNVVYKGERVTVQVTAKMFDGTVASMLDFRYRYYCSDEIKTGKVKTDENGIAKIYLDTNIQNIEYETYASLHLYNEELDGDGESEYCYFAILPYKEKFEVNNRYKDGKINFNIKTYLYDLNNEEEFYKGQNINRVVKVYIDKYIYERVVESTYYNELTNTTEEKYRIIEKLESQEIFDVATENGLGELSIDNPFEEGLGGTLRISAEITSEDGTIIYCSNIDYWSPFYINSGRGTNYSIKEDSDTVYKLNEQISGDILYLNENTDKVLKTMYLIDTVDGVEVVFSDGSSRNFKFESKYAPYIIIRAIVFDGDSMNYVASKYCSVDEKDISMNLNITTNQKEYRPGDTVKINVTTKDRKGNPIKSEVNISVVDESYMKNDTYGTRGILDSLYNRENNVIVMYASHINSDLAEGGGGGGGEDRENFVDTAAFKTIITDESGNGYFEFVLPDNLTTWRITAQSIAKNLEVDSHISSITVRLPFFVQTILKEEYLENDQPKISVKSNGNNLKTKDDVDFIIVITAPDGVETNIERKAKGHEYIEIDMDELKLGTYTLKVQAKTGEQSDIIIKKFNVVSSLFTTRQNESVELKKGQEIKITNGVGKLYLYNTSLNKVYTTLLELKNTNAISNDQIITSIVANELINKLTDESVSNENSIVFFEEGLIRSLANEDPGPMLTAKTLSIGYEYINKELSKQYFETLIGNDYIDIRTKLIAYWGMSSLKEPVLVDLKEFKNNIEGNNIYEKILLGLCFADIGDYNNANQIFDELKDNITKDKLEQYGLLTLLAIKIDSKLKDDMYNYMIKNETSSEILNFLKISYAKNYINKNDKDSSIKYTINGEEKVMNLKPGKANIINIKNTDEFVIKEISKNISATLEQVKVFNKITENKVEMDKKYYVGNKEVNSFEVGDIVTVVINVGFNENTPKGVYMIEDMIPNAISYLHGYKTNDVYATTYPSNISGQKVTFVIYYDGVNKPYVIYQCRVSGVGIYVSDGTILKNIQNSIISYMKGITIEVM